MYDKTSVIMPTYNRSEFLNLTLAGFTIQTSKDFNIVIVDDGSIDDTKAVVDTYQGKLDITYVHQENRGRSKSRNTGLKHTNANHIIFCDDDRIPNKNFIAVHQANKSQNLAAMGMKEKILVRYNSKMQWKENSLKILIKQLKEPKKDIFTEDFFTERDIVTDFENIISTFSVGGSTDNYRDVVEKYGNNLEGFYFPWVTGTTANMSFVRKNIEDFLFDENYTSWGMEDTDYSFMLYQRGYRFRMIDDAVNYHQNHPGNFSLERDSLNKNVKYFCQKYDDLSCYLFANMFGIKRMSMIELNELYHAVTEKTVGEDSVEETLKKLLTNTLY
ncbi:glycosyltransferase family 2 protein [Anaerocolumna xylanovorans]|uniref:Glycosyltransferase involved in cell wall bisynthesis n=1 Tax=Anaerocolumna xylanovorans DSM 12503 TaxID=1121345 RepID=A0A1M7YF93_9FIRM|nr:glycosyltransferase [Anaerocolumna xylanovorans]SHO51315.1 Glycosyltransferase involved in cell wall bisynthesis [Anaerocolumna xylanovorans DSM 12503]